MENLDNCLKLNNEKMNEVEDKISNILNGLEEENGQTCTAEINYFDNEHYDEDSIEFIIPNPEVLITNTLQQWINKCKTKAKVDFDELKELNLNDIHEYQEKLKQHQKDLRKAKDPEARRYMEISWILDYYLNNKSKVVVQAKLSPPKYKKMHHYTNEVCNIHKPKVDESKRNEIAIRKDVLKYTKMPRENIINLKGRNHEKVSNYKINVSKSLQKNITELPKINDKLFKNKKVMNSIEWVRHGLI
jgi:hypothetical protein